MLNKLLLLSLFFVFSCVPLTAQDNDTERITEIKKEYEITNQGVGNQIYGVKKLRYTCEGGDGPIICYYDNYGLRLITGRFDAEGVGNEFEIYLMNGDLLFIFYRSTFSDPGDAENHAEINEKRFYFYEDEAIKCLYKDNVYDQFTDATNQEVACTDIGYLFYKQVMKIIDLPANSIVDCLWLED